MSKLRIPKNRSAMIPCSGKQGRSIRGRTNHSCFLATRFPNFALCQQNVAKLVASQAVILRRNRACGEAEAGKQLRSACRSRRQHSPSEHRLNFNSFHDNALWGKAHLFIHMDVIPTSSFLTFSFTVSSMNSRGQCPLLPSSLATHAHSPLVSSFYISNFLSP